MRKDIGADARYEKIEERVRQALGAIKNALTLAN
jgi:hypothetical protein